MLPKESEKIRSLRQSLFISVVAFVLGSAGCGSSSRSAVTASTTKVPTTKSITVTATSSEKPPSLGLSTMRELAVLRANAWWWTEQRASSLLEANALSALHAIPDFANSTVDHAQCSGNRRGIHYLGRRNLFQQFTCTVSTFVGVGSVKRGKTLTVRVLALTRDHFDVDLVSAGG
jgi:hypothetical protein